MIIKGSRYHQTSETRNDETRNIAVSQKFSTTKFITVIADEGQSLQYLASLYLNDASMYWKIADLNPNIAFPDRLSAGTVIKVPLL